MLQNWSVTKNGSYFQTNYDFTANIKQALCYCAKLYTTVEHYDNYI